MSSLFVAVVMAVCAVLFSICAYLYGADRPPRRRAECLCAFAAFGHAVASAFQFLTWWESP
jgi:hypothetical protein